MLGKCDLQQRARDPSGWSSTSLSLQYDLWLASRQVSQTNIAHSGCPELCSEVDYLHANRAEFATASTDVFAVQLQEAVASGLVSRWQRPSANLTASRTHPTSLKNDTTQRNDNAAFPSKPASCLSRRLRRRKFPISQTMSQVPSFGECRILGCFPLKDRSRTLQSFEYVQLLSLGGMAQSGGSSYHSE